jgi:hypothetical protein
MARSTAKQVDEEVDYDIDEEIDESQPKRRRRSSGPRKEKPIYLLFRVTDENNAPVPNARLQIVLATKDTDKVLELQSEDKSLTLAKIELQQPTE